ncbi:uncharacterized protein FPRO_14750 [Fusarium proliferatum ET1]|uniref:Uncharacterized protein n=1 Tax=Fusarium proliferatum (strain ET1) TaxID=1227346 RepID=A0A1L7VX48_FUSPR|nr:uncharacterized protein FPRO_14750 [Fusarium proliferatum ET1]CZR44998.1 uncharacterized protein FPRO_14750 [Fusarium proliferatum ET1]
MGSDRAGWFRAYPTHDIFCIKARSWKSLQKDSLVINAAIGGGARNIAFEYDPSWNVNLPKTYYDFFKEDSTRNHYCWPLEKNAEHHDCHGDYVEISLGNIHVLNQYSPSRWFKQFRYKLNLLGENCEQDHSSYQPSYDDDILDSGFSSVFEITECAFEAVDNGNGVFKCGVLVRWNEEGHLRIFGVS